jgi:hypothetical protein
MGGRRRLTDGGMLGGRRLRRGSGFLFASDRLGLLGCQIALATSQLRLAPSRLHLAPRRLPLGPDRLGLVLPGPRLAPGRPRLAPGRPRLAPGGGRSGSRYRAVRAGCGALSSRDRPARPSVHLGPRTGVAVRVTDRPGLQRRGRGGLGDPGSRPERCRGRTGFIDPGRFRGLRSRWRLTASHVPRSGALLRRVRDRLAEGSLPAGGGRIGPGAGRPRSGLGSTVAGVRGRRGLAGAVGCERAGLGGGGAGLLRAGVR